MIKTCSLTLAAALALALPAIAQQAGPQIRTMPLPPSAGDPAPKETGAASRPAAQPQRPARARPKATEAEGGLASPPANRGGRTRGTASSAESFDRPKRFVPEEFDRGGQDDGDRARPIVTPGGRAGVGMRF